MGADMTWRSRAMCDGLEAGEMDAIFFPHPNSDGAEAKAICRVCPVAAECLKFALDTRQEFGVWGAMTEHERFKVTAAKKFPNRPNAPTPDPRCGTYPGAKAHRKRLEQFCDECRDARNEYESTRRRASRAAQREAS
jgi:WhiB family redox-sensing transcriptional regulator